MDETLWYYRSVAEALRDARPRATPGGPAEGGPADELARAVDDLEWEVSRAG